MICLSPRVLPRTYRSSWQLYLCSIHALQHVVTAALDCCLLLLVCYPSTPLTNKGSLAPFCTPYPTKIDLSPRGNQSDFLAGSIPTITPLPSSLLQSAVALHPESHSPAPPTATTNLLDYNPFVTYSLTACT